MPLIKFRSVNPGLRPRRTLLEVPGWAGEPDTRQTGARGGALGGGSSLPASG
jgi:hypothetical protein